MPRALKVWLGLGLVSLAVVGILVVRFVMNPTKDYVTDGPAMEPTLFAGDSMDVRLFSQEEVARGDIVVARSPMDDVDIVKRVVAVGGDTIASDGDCNLVLNGEPVASAPVQCPEGDYAASLFAEERQCFRLRLAGVTFVMVNSGAGCRATGEIEVPEGELFLRGDHPDRSNDSTNPYIGTVPVANVVGIVETDG